MRCDKFPRFISFFDTCFIKNFYTNEYTRIKISIERSMEKISVCGMSVKSEEKQGRGAARNKKFLQKLEAKKGAALSEGELRN